jgi:hypothetical protein
MHNHMRSRAPEIARNFVGLWNDHCMAYDELALPYVDHLIDEVLTVESLSPWQLKNRLFEMVPSLKLGTAERLIGLKFPNHRSGLLSAPAH